MRERFDCRIEWIGDIPCTWAVSRIKDLVHDMQRGTQPQYADGTNFFITNQACLSTYSFRPEKRKECEPIYEKKGRYRPGDILLASTGEGVLGKCVLANHLGHADSHVSIVRLKPGNSAPFLNYLLTVSYSLLNSRYAKGSTKQTELQREAFLAHFLALPIRDEQRRIAARLDLQTNRIDKRIELLGKKRELLRTLRKSVIHEAVTGCAEGTTVRVKNVAAINPPTRLPKTGLVEFFPMDSIGVDGGLILAQEKDVSVAAGFSQFRNGDVLFAKVTPCFENGKSAVGENLIGIGALATTEVTVLRPTKAVLAQFLHYRIKGLDFADMGVNEMKGAGGLKRVPEKQAANFNFRLPDIDVQRRIVEYLDKKTAQVDKQIDLIDHLETLLKEQRKAIIHEAVTGKIDLSQYEPPPTVD